eukprot:scaffold85505_cov63-Phaeocystis_antarctica.AAC.2
MPLAMLLAVLLAMLLAVLLAVSLAMQRVRRALAVRRGGVGGGGSGGRAEKGRAGRAGEGGASGAAAVTASRSILAPCLRSAGVAVPLSASVAAMRLMAPGAVW